VWAGREREAIALLERARQLSPTDPHLWTFHHVRALAHFSLGKVEAAAEWARQASRLPNGTYSPYATLTASLATLERMTEAETAVAELFMREPDYDQVRARADLQLAREEFMARYLDGLRRAGVPEWGGQHEGQTGRTE
jgi:Flp pilus assembly protein TadD